MADKLPFVRVKCECKAPTKPGDPGRIVFEGNTDSLLINSHLRGAMNVIDHIFGMAVRQNTRYKYRRENGQYQNYYEGTIYVRQPGITKSALERMVEYIYLHAEQVYNKVETGNEWGILYRGGHPKEY